MSDRTHRASRRQVGALCWRTADGERQVLLVTSRDTGRWVTPKGNRMAALSDSKAATEEAFEEAGVRGTVSEKPVGVFHYDKRLGGSAARHLAVDLYALEVQAEFADWPEARERTRRWFRQAEAAKAVSEPELQALIANFQPPEI